MNSNNFSKMSYKGMTSSRMQNMAPEVGIETGSSLNLLATMGVRAPLTTKNKKQEYDPIKEADMNQSLAEKTIRQERLEQAQLQEKLRRIEDEYTARKSP